MKIENRRLERKYFVLCRLIVGGAENGNYLQSFKNGRNAWESLQSLTLLHNAFIDQPRTSTQSRRIDILKSFLRVSLLTLVLKKACLELAMCHHMILDKKNHIGSSLMLVIYANTPLPILPWGHFSENTTRFRTHLSEIACRDARIVRTRSSRSALTFNEVLI